MVAVATVTCLHDETKTPRSQSRNATPELAKVEAGIFVGSSGITGSRCTPPRRQAAGLAEVRIADLAEVLCKLRLHVQQLLPMGQRNRRLAVLLVDFR